MATIILPPNTTNIDTQSSTPQPSFAQVSLITSAPTFNPLYTDSCHTLDPKNLYYCPVRRYCDWLSYDFDDRSFLRLQLNYDKLTWNYEAYNEDEFIAYSLLPESVRTALTDFAGYDEDRHDCCQGHYYDYGWSDFDFEGMEEVKDAVILLGYDQLKWDNDIATPLDEMFWDDLTVEFQNAASAGLCYSRETWNEEPLDLWPSDAILPGQFELDAEPLILSPGATNSPTLSPCYELDIDIEYYCPVRRYCEWDYFQNESRDKFSSQLGYSGTTWNYEDVVFINGIEELAFESLEDLERNGLRDLGFTEAKHDCCHNHYNDYGWSDFIIYEMNEELQAYEIMGYNEETWENGGDSNYEDIAWDDLPPEIRAAMFNSLCYNKGLWDGLPLTAWSDDVRLPGAFKINLDPNTSIGSSLFSLGGAMRYSSYVGVFVSFIISVL